ncbi:MAG: hypothetical protein ACYTE3_09960 [Planctomycetota bacterium]
MKSNRMVRILLLSSVLFVVCAAGEGNSTRVTTRSVRRILSDLRSARDNAKVEVPDEILMVSIVIPDEIRLRLIASQPASGDYLLKIIGNPNDSLHRQATKALLCIWESLSVKQMRTYFKQSVVASIEARPLYPQGMDSGMATRYSIRYGWQGWPKSKNIKMRTVSRTFLDGVLHRRPFRYKGPMASTGGIPIGDLSRGSHTAQLVTEYTVTCGEHKFTDKIESKKVKFEIVGWDVLRRLVAPKDPELTRLVEGSFQFREIRDPNEKNSVLGGVPFDLWRPQNSARIRGSQDEYALHMPIYRLAEPLPVDLCFNVEFRLEGGGKSYRGEPIIIEKGRKGELGYFRMADTIAFVRDHQGFVPLKITLTPSPETAFFARGRVTKYYDGSLTSQTLRVKSYLFRYDRKSPLARELKKMLEDVEHQENIDRQVLGGIRDMASPNPYWRLSGIVRIRTAHQKNRDVSPAIPFLRKMLEGKENEWEREAAQRAEELLAELDRGR